LAAAAAVLVAAAVLLAVGRGPLAAPPLTRPDRWGRWLAGRDPAVAALAVLRLIALAAVWYVAAASVIGIVLRLLDAHALVALVDRVTVPALRRVLVATAGFSLASAPVVASAAPTTTSTVVGESRPPPTLTMRLLPANEPAPPAPSPPQTAEPPASPAEPALRANTWRVQPGDCFWSMAEDVLRESWGRPPTDAEIVPYWRALIDANRAQLADAANADLVFPGQIFAVPAPPPAR
jgi:hypothetical protein